MQLESAADALRVFSEGANRLKFSSTKLNRHSSRSHAVCFVNLTRRVKGAGGRGAAVVSRGVAPPPPLSPDDISAGEAAGAGGAPKPHESTAEAARTPCAPLSQSESQQGKGGVSPTAKGGVSHTDAPTPRGTARESASPHECAVAGEAMGGLFSPGTFMALRRPAPHANKPRRPSALAPATRPPPRAASSSATSESSSDLAALQRKHTVMHSRLTMVDLAGSERLGRSGAEGVVLNEARTINSSLLALGSVINALAGAENGVRAKEAGSTRNSGARSPRMSNASSSPSHVPFRNSQLTRLLRQSLLHAKVHLLICLSPDVADAKESRSTLQFGERAMHVRSAVRSSGTGTPLPA